MISCYSRQDMESSTRNSSILFESNGNDTIFSDITDTENTVFLFDNITAKPLYQTVAPNYAQQVLYKVQTLHLPTLPVDTAYIGKSN